MTDAWELEGTEEDVARIRTALESVNQSGKSWAEMMAAAARRDRARRNGANNSHEIGRRGRDETDKEVAG